MGESLVVVPVSDGDVLSVAGGGVTWVCAFTDLAALARFAVLRGEGGREWSYVTISGAFLLSALPRRTGVAVDLGSEQPELLPPAAVVT